MNSMSPCGEMVVAVGDPNGNECMVLGYGVEDGSGSVHPHLNYYSIRVEYSPRQVGVVPLETQVILKGQGSVPAFDLLTDCRYVNRYNDIDWDYNSAWIHFIPTF